MSTHTAGPWEVAGPWPNVSVGIDDPSKDDHTTNYRGFIPICFMAEDTTTEDVMDHANARLIAAAPELLELLIKSTELMSRDEYHTNSDWAYQLIANRAAIDKAKAQS